MNTKDMKSLSDFLNKHYIMTSPRAEEIESVLTHTEVVLIWIQDHLPKEGMFAQRYIDAVIMTRDIVGDYFDATDDDEEIEE